MNRAAHKTLCVFIFSICTQGLSAVPYLGSISQIIGFLLVIFYLGEIISSGRIRRPNANIHIIAIFFIWCLLSVLWSVNTSTSLDMVKTYSELFILAFIIWDLARTSEDRSDLMMAFILGNTLIVIVTIINASLGHFIYVTGRTQALGLDPNDMALMNAISIPMAWYLATESKYSKWFLLFCLFIGITVLAILLSGSRAGFVSCLVGLSIFLVLSPRRFITRKLVALFIAASLLALLAFLVPQNSFERIQGIYGEVTGGTMAQRTIIWEIGLKVWKDHPVIGTGAGTFNQFMLSYFGQTKAAHNAYLAIAVELGLIGLILFIFIIIILLWNSKYAGKVEKILFFVVTATWMVGIMTLSWNYTKTTWFLLGLIAASGSKAENVRGSRNPIEN